MTKKAYKIDLIITAIMIYYVELLIQQFNNVHDVAVVLVPFNVPVFQMVACTKQCTPGTLLGAVHYQRLDGTISQKLKHTQYNLRQICYLLTSCSARFSKCSDQRDHKPF
eukprot:EC097445.1.p2 GENE.EC097445.1~~EC097445.1.p2  ORF type:complete len:110 (-),score=6.20 EC097445.1:53-382(-)